MSIYQKKRNSKFYRKLWEQYHGCLIPKDELGRTFDIHHIDGDRTNNSIENLYACPIQEHYDIHESQGDWEACKLIAKRMKVSPELISELARKAALKRVEEGTHNFLDGENARKTQLKLVEMGVHHFLDGKLSKKVQQKRITEGTHNFLGGKLQRKLVDEGKHHLLSGDIQRKSNAKRIIEGTHNLLGVVTCRNRQGNVVQVPKDIYQKQKEVTKDMTQWEFVMINSFEAKRRNT